MPATTLAQIIDAFAATLAPGGTPVGTIAKVWSRGVRVPYQDALPALFIRPMRVNRSYIAARAKINAGVMELTYLDATPEQQQASLAAVEDALYANRESILMALEADVTLGGQISVAAEQVDEFYTPEGPYQELLMSMYVAVIYQVTFRGPKLTI